MGGQDLAHPNLTVSYWAPKTAQHTLQRSDRLGPFYCFVISRSGLRQ